MTVKKKFIGVIKDFDMFGYSIKLNFNRQGNVHKTFIGGLFSMVIKFAMIYYAIHYLVILIYNLDDKISTSIFGVDVDDGSIVVYPNMESSTLLFWIIRSSRGGET